jgi:integrase
VIAGFPHCPIPEWLDSAAPSSLGANMALRAGVHPKVVQERLGHANISITLGVYSHVLEEMDEDAAEKGGCGCVGES